MTSAATPFVFPSAYKPGGIVSFMFERFCCRSGKSWSDPSGQGRYVVNTIIGTNKVSLAIGYHVSESLRCSCGADIDPHAA